MDEFQNGETVFDLSKALYDAKLKSVIYAKQNFEHKSAQAATKRLAMDMITKDRFGNYKRNPSVLYTLEILYKSDREERVFLNEVVDNPIYPRSLREDSDSKLFFKNVMLAVDIVTLAGGPITKGITKGLGGIS